MTVRKFGKFRLEADDRTDDMSLDALQCRSMNHPWARVPLSPSRRAELTKLGQTEWVWNCARCDAQRSDRFELPHFTTLATTINYPDNYLCPKGTGRLRRAEARKALFMRADM